MINVVKLKNQLAYDPESGIFKWRSSGSGRRDTLIAGCIKKKKGNVWRRIVFEGQAYTSGQLAWTIMTGKFPEFIIDHIDGDPLNDKWVNLRRGDKGVDQRNARKSNRNKTGITGVKWDKRTKHYTSFIGVDGKQKYLGCSKDLFEAACKRKSAEIKYNYSPRHGL